MRKAFILLFLLKIVAVSFVFSQKVERLAAEAVSYGIDGTHLLWEEDKKVEEFLKANPGYFEQARLNKTTAWNFSVGTTKSWSAVDFTNNNQRYTINTTCRAVGEKCYVFVENDVWTNRVNQAAIDSIKAAFDNRTPINSGKGIYQTNTETFGYPPDVDNDPRIIIVILDIKDGYDGEGGYIEGYFSSSNEVGANMAEMFFIDAYPLDLKTAGGLQGGLSTLAHEFQHMIHWNYHKTSSQLTFVNEGCSLVAEVICGYSIYNQDRYTGETNHYLLDWRNSTSFTNNEVLRDYSRAARFNAYLLDQFGVGIFRKIVETQQYGLNAYTDALSKVGASIAFKDVLINWFIANNLDDKSINSAWGYDYKNLVKPYGNVLYNPSIDFSNTVEPYAVEYITFKAGSNLVSQFSSTSNSLKIKAIITGSGQKKVVDVPLNGSFSEAEFGTTYNTVTFAIMNPENTYDESYSLKATGISHPVELKWDETETSGYLKRPPLDTICVTFDAIAGGRLDSVKIAVRRAGSITGAVYELGSSANPSKLGKRLSDFYTLTTSQTPSYPYPVPYPNWLTVNLSSQNIKTDKAFAVGVGVPQDTSKFSYVMVTKRAGTDFYHSYTYQNSPSGTTSPGWYYLTDGAGNVWLYLIRAYVGFENTTRVVELQPVGFKLEQNYPNPFNPETRIKFRLEKSGNTKITVYDIMGREVNMLLNEFRPAGEHEISFNASNYSSGVYYYKLESDKNISIKKMMLVR